MANGNKTVKQIVEEMQNDWAQSLVAKAAGESEVK